MTKKSADEVMTIIDLAAYLKLSKSTLYKLCQEGKVPGQKIGKHWRFHREVIELWLGHRPQSKGLERRVVKRTLKKFESKRGRRRPPKEASHAS